jgi:hypothetical protein
MKSETLSATRNMNRAAIHRLFDDALDELDITFDTYFDLDRHRPKCLHVLNWLRSHGISPERALVMGPFPQPLAVFLKKAGVPTREIRTTPGKKGSPNPEERVAPSRLEEVLSPGERYDLILCDDLLQHLADPNRTLQLLIDRLADHGTLMMITPNVARGSSRLMLLTGKNILPDPPLASREYSLREVKGLLSGHRLAALDGEYIIGKKILDYFHAVIPMSLTAYLGRKFYSAVQILIPPFRSHLFVAARKQETHV